MKVLVVAHPDDEILWFSPLSFDLIIIAFLTRHDKPSAKRCRELAISEHPLNAKIILLNLDESGFWKDRSRIKQHLISRERLFHSLNAIKKRLPITTIFTHNSKGEYGHDDHILVHQVVTSLFNDVEIFCPTELNFTKCQNKVISVSNDIDFYNRAKAVYCKNKAWTWQHNYTPPDRLYYSLHDVEYNDTC